MCIPSIEFGKETIKRWNCEGPGNKSFLRSRIREICIRVRNIKREKIIITGTNFRNKRGWRFKSNARRSNVGVKKILWHRGIDMKTYTELMKLKTYEERFMYLREAAKVGDRTFGGYRYLNQMLYKNPLWVDVAEKAIIRDNGCDLAIRDRIIYGTINVHHMNPISIDDLLSGNPDVFNLEYLITTDADKTHKPLHYGGMPKVETIIERKPYDTCLWK